MEIMKNNPHVVRLKALVPNTDYTIFTNEVFKDANDYFRYTLDMHKNYPELMSLIKDQLVFTLNNEDNLMNKPFNIDAVLGALAKTKGLTVELNGKSRNNSQVSITK